MHKIGITGQSGFIGTHLFNLLKLKKEFELVHFEDDYFSDAVKLQKFVAECNTIVHLAAMNRHNDPEVLYQTNIGLVQKLISSCEATGSRPHIIFSSSTQEERDNLYGKSKLEGRLLFKDWAAKHNARFTAFIIPNVFGPFGNPFYNSVIATFCHQLTHNQQPQIQVDGMLKLIYVSELTEEFYKAVKCELACQNSLISEYAVPHTSEQNVSEILQVLESYKSLYFEKGIIPSLDNTFHKNLFNTFVTYIDFKTYFPRKYIQHSDDRGTFVETVKLYSGGQVSFSTTRSGITRGNHFHTRKAERFAVIKGKAKIQLRRIGTGEILDFFLDGTESSYVDMPVWYTHNITNVGEEDLLTIFWINEHFDPSDTDTYFEQV